MNPNCTIPSIFSNIYFNIILTQNVQVFPMMSFLLAFQPKPYHATPLRGNEEAATTEVGVGQSDYVGHKRKVNINNTMYE
jgi:hypothetical protein